MPESHEPPSVRVIRIVSQAVKTVNELAANMSNQEKTGAISNISKRMVRDIQNFLRRCPVYAGDEEHIAQTQHIACNCLAKKLHLPRVGLNQAVEGRRSGFLAPDNNTVLFATNEGLLPPEQLHAPEVCHPDERERYNLSGIKPPGYPSSSLSARAAPVGHGKGVERRT